jgi:hypothetical protein
MDNEIQDGLTPITKASFDAFNDEDKLGWKPLDDDATKFIPKGFSMITEGLLKGRAVPRACHALEDPNQTVCKKLSSF